jgi:MoaA/NifB/PqqE/SkfB family radical SAM enzyme
VSLKTFTPEQLAVLRTLLAAAAQAAGWDAVSIEAEGDRMLMALRRGPRSLPAPPPPGRSPASSPSSAESAGASFLAWIRPASDEPSFSRAGAWSVGYRGDLPAGADSLLRSLVEALADHPAPPRPAEPDPALIFGTDQLEIRVTLACNEHCVFCNSWHGADNLTTDLPAAVALLERARLLGTRKLVISGGEPLLVPWIPELAREARRLGFSYICLQTNAVLLSRRRRTAPTERARQDIGGASLRSVGLSVPSPQPPTPAPWSLLQATAPDEVLVSAHGSTPEVLAAVTRRPALAQAHLDGLCRLLASDFRIIVNFVVCRQNLADLPDFVRFLARQPKRPLLLSLSYVAPIGLAWDHRHETIQRYSDAAPAVLAALRMARSLGLDAVLPEYCGIPTCVLPELREFADPADERRPVHVPPDKMLVPRCEPCPWKPRCSGIFRRYVEMFGDEIPPSSPL